MRPAAATQAADATTKRPTSGDADARTDATGRTPTIFEDDSASASARTMATARLAAASCTARLRPMAKPTLTPRPRPRPSAGELRRRLLLQRTWVRGETMHAAMLLSCVQPATAARSLVLHAQRCLLCVRHRGGGGGLERRSLMECLGKSWNAEETRVRKVHVEKSLRKIVVVSIY